MNAPELRELVEQYKNSTIAENKIIYRKLMNIAHICYDSQGAEQLVSVALAEELSKFIKYLSETEINQRGDEFIGVKEIIDEFTDIISIIDRRNQRQLLFAQKNVQGVYGGQDSNYNYMAFSAKNSEFADGEDLLDAFKVYLKENGKSKAESTINDYASRIKTFAKNDSGTDGASDKYLGKIISTGALGDVDYKRIEDKVLFTYNNLEIILARFDTRKSDEELAQATDDNKSTKNDKQKNNIRSALRKLNEFKRERNG